MEHGAWSKKRYYPLDEDTCSRCLNRPRRRPRPRPRNRKKDNGVEDEDEYEDEPQDELNPRPATLI
jgi:hypothetical protein